MRSRSRSPDEVWRWLGLAWGWHDESDDNLGSHECGRHRQQPPNDNILPLSRDGGGAVRSLDGWNIARVEDALIGFWMAGIARTEDGDGKHLVPYGKNSGDEEKKTRRSAKHRYGVLCRSFAYFFFNFKNDPFTSWWYCKKNINYWLPEYVFFLLDSIFTPLA